MIPLCPICGHRMYYAGDVIVQGASYRRYACIHCNHVEDWLIMGETHKDEFIFMK